MEVDECKQQLLILVLSLALCVTLITDCVVQPCQVGSQSLYQHVDITSGHTVDDSHGRYETQSLLICLLSARRCDKSTLRQEHGVFKVHMMLACMSAQGRQAHGRMQILLLLLGMGPASSKSFIFFWPWEYRHACEKGMSMPWEALWSS